MTPEPVLTPSQQLAKRLNEAKIVPVTVMTRNGLICSPPWDRAANAIGDIEHVDVRVSLRNGATAFYVPSDRMWYAVSD